MKERRIDDQGLHLEVRSKYLFSVSTISMDIIQREEVAGVLILPRLGGGARHERLAGADE